MSIPMRARRDGQTVEFRFEDLGERDAGVWQSRFTVDGRWVTSSTEYGDSIERRLANDVMAMASQGYDPETLECFDGSEWSPVLTPDVRAMLPKERA